MPHAAALPCCLCPAALLCLRGRRRGGLLRLDVDLLDLLRLERVILRLPLELLLRLLLG